MVPSFVSNVLVDDPDLGAGLSGSRLRMAQRHLVASVVAIDERSWAPDEDAQEARGGVGMLILEGLMVRRVGSAGRFGAELLGPGDVLRPWQHDGEDVTLPFETTFRVVQRVLAAQLDLRFTARLAPYPEVVGNLVGRAMQRSRTLAVNMAIVHQTRVDARLLLLFWHLADRWGRVTSDGVRVSIVLTHQLIADLVASRRPSVTTALAHLEQTGRVTRTDTGWLLTGEPPRDVYDTAAASAAERP